MGSPQHQQTRERSNSNSPHFRFLLHKLLHQIRALCASKYHDLNTPLLEIRLAADKTLILPDNHTADLVQHTSTSAHVTRRKRRIHRSTLISGCRKSTCVLQGRYLRLRTSSIRHLLPSVFQNTGRSYMKRCAAFLYSHIVPSTQYFAILWD